MAGRIRRLLMAERLPAQQPPAPVLCPLCDRPVPPSQQDAHHWVPKSKGGRDTALLHRICHRQVHALFTETELARDHPTAQALRAQPEVATFVAWVQTKPDDFFEKPRKSQRLRRR